MEKIIIFLLFFSISISFAQQNEEKPEISAGFSLGYKNFNGDIKNWDFGAAPGLILKIRMNNKLSYFIWADYLKLTSNKFPQAYYISTEAGIDYFFLGDSKLQAGLTGGLSNATFNFDSIDKENNIESEFGIFGGIVVGYNLSEQIRIESRAVLGNLFTSPINTVEKRLNIAFLIRL